jgi:hypothetical protein
MSGRRGLMASLSASCSSCQEESDLQTSSSITVRGSRICDLRSASAVYHFHSGAASRERERESHGASPDSYR